MLAWLMSPHLDEPKQPSEFFPSTMKKQRQTPAEMHALFRSAFVSPRE